jgi:hypothetical protein
LPWVSFYCFHFRTARKMHSAVYSQNLSLPPFSF